MVIFCLHGQEFGVPILQVREIIRLVEIAHIPDAPNFLEGVINVRGQVIAVINLAKQFHMADNVALTKQARIMIVEIAKTTVGLLVDEVPQALRITDDEILEVPPVLQTTVNLAYIRGIAKIGERLIMILDLQKVLAAHTLSEVTQLTKESKHG